MDDRGGWLDWLNDVNVITPPPLFSLEDPFQLEPLAENPEDLTSTMIDTVDRGGAETPAPADIQADTHHEITGEPREEGETAWLLQQAIDLRPRESATNANAVALDVEDTWGTPEWDRIDWDHIAANQDELGGIFDNVCWDPDLDRYTIPQPEPDIQTAADNGTDALVRDLADTPRRRRRVRTRMPPFPRRDSAAPRRQVSFASPLEQPSPLQLHEPAHVALPGQWTDENLPPSALARRSQSQPIAQDPEDLALSDASDIVGYLHADEPAEQALSPTSVSTESQEDPDLVPSGVLQRRTQGTPVQQPSARRQVRRDAERRTGSPYTASVGKKRLR